MKYEFRYDKPSRVLLTVLGLGRRFSSIDVDDTTLRVRMGWGFRATIPRATITSAMPNAATPISRGAHGWRGRWLVNGAGRGLVTFTIDPPARGRCVGVPIHIHELTVSASAPTELIGALAVG
jgi:hypothetical protein